MRRQVMSAMYNNYKNGAAQIWDQWNNNKIKSKLKNYLVLLSSEFTGQV